MAEWSFSTNHALVLLCIAARIREYGSANIAATLGITEQCNGLRRGR